jgi:transketolase
MLRLVAVFVTVSVTVLWNFCSSISVMVFVVENLQKKEVCVLVVSMILSFVFVAIQVEAEKNVVGTRVVVMVRFEPGIVEVTVRFDVRKAVEGGIDSVVVMVKFCVRKAVEGRTL